MGEGLNGHGAEGGDRPWDELSTLPPSGLAGTPTPSAAAAGAELPGGWHHWGACTGCGSAPPESFPSTGLALQKEGQSGGSQPAATSSPCCRALRVPHQPTQMQARCHPVYPRVTGSEPLSEGPRQPCLWGTAHRLPHSGKAGAVGCSTGVWQWWENVGGTPGRSSPAHSTLKVQGHEPGGAAVKPCPWQPSPSGHM